MTLVANKLYLAMRFSQSKAYYVCMTKRGERGRNARVCEKARGGHPPNPQVPRVEIELIPQLLTVLHIIGNEGQHVVAPPRMEQRVTCLAFSRREP